MYLVILGTRDSRSVSAAARTCRSVFPKLYRFVVCVDLVKNCRFYGFQLTYNIQKFLENSLILINFIVHFIIRVQFHSALLFGFYFRANLHVRLQNCSLVGPYISSLPGYMVTVI